MPRYDVFISYRKDNKNNADLILKTLVEQYGFNKDSIFIDKNKIGPEYFDTKIKNALTDSYCVVLLVSRNCFIPKKDDWFIREIKTALDLGLTIIPVFYDDIKSLNSKDITSELNKSFTQSEISVLKKSQGIPYNFDLSDSTFSKLVKFVHQAKDRKENILNKTIKWIKRIAATLLCFAVAYSLFLGIGFLWGYYFSSTTVEDVLKDNCKFENNSSFFEFKGLKAEYNHITDSITFHSETFNGETPESNYDVLLQACSASGSLIFLERNIANLKYIKYLKSGSKPGQYTTIAISIAAAVGAFFGFSQGSTLGRTMRQHETVLEIYPLLKNKKEWNPIFEKRKDNYLYANSYLQDKIKYQNNIDKSAYISKNILFFVQPDDSIPIAKNAGLTDVSILVKYNNWEIGKHTLTQLNEEIKLSKSKPKSLVFASIDADKFKFSEITLPSGTVGIRFSCGDKTDLTLLITAYNEWKNQKSVNSSLSLPLPNA